MARHNPPKRIKIADDVLMQLGNLEAQINELNRQKGEILKAFIAGTGTQLKGRYGITPDGYIVEEGLLPLPSIQGEVIPVKPEGKRKRGSS
jgi:hypothetical protein